MIGMRMLRYVTLRLATEYTPLKWGTTTPSTMSSTTSLFRSISVVSSTISKTRSSTLPHVGPYCCDAYTEGMDEALKSHKYCETKSLREFGPFARSLESPK